MKLIKRLGLLLVLMATLSPLALAHSGPFHPKQIGQGNTLSLDECQDLADYLNNGVLADGLYASCEYECHGPRNCNYRVEVNET